MSLSHYPGGGGGALPYWRWRGRAAGQGMIFTVIHIDTGYLNRPNWLLAGYSVYHRVASRASQPTMFMTGPRSRHQRRRARDATDFYEWYTAERVRTNTGYAYESFSKVYCDRVYFLCERFETGSGFRPPPPQRHPPSKWKSSAPPPPDANLWFPNRSAMGPC